MILSFFTGWAGAAHIFIVLLVAITGIFFVILRRYPADRLKKAVEAPLFDRVPLILALVLTWTVLVTLEFWVLGMSSLIPLGDESEIAYPYFAHLAKLPLWPRPRFDPDIMGGSDLPSLFNTSAGGLFSLEVWLTSIFGPDSTYVIHKLANSFVATIGAFLLAHRGLKAPASLSLLIGFFYSASFYFVITGTFIHGLGYASIPLGVYVLVYRLDDRGYYLGCFAYGILASISMSIAHSAIAFYAALVCVSLYAGAIWRLRFAIGVAIVSMLILLNWADAIYGIFSSGPFTVRFQMADDFHVRFSPSFLIETLTGASYMNGNTLPIALVCFAVALAFDRRRALLVLLLAFSPWLIGLIQTVMPFRALGLAALAAIDPQYPALGASAVNVVVLAVTATTVAASAEKPLRGRRWQYPLVLSFLVALPISAAVCYKGLSYFLMDSGHSRAVFHLDGVAALADRVDGRYRVLAGPNSRAPRSMFFDNALLAYGLPTIGGNFNLIDLWHHAFWKRAGVATARGQVGLTTDTTRCDEAYSLEHLDLLRLGGTRYIVSRTPIRSDELALVASPTEFPSALCAGTPLQRLALILARKPVSNPFIYEISDPLPTVYFARGARHSDHALDTDAFWEQVAQTAPRRIVSGPAIPEDVTFDGHAEIVSVNRKQDGYVIETMGDQGLLVVGHPYLPFWEATIDGASANIVSVNGIQMAVKTPAGPHTLSFTYRRWLPSDYVLQLFGNWRSWVSGKDAPK